jgi:hypothetical protein
MFRILNVAALLFASVYSITGEQKDPPKKEPPKLHTVELFPEDYAGKTFAYPVWVFSQGISKYKEVYVIQFRDGSVMPAKHAPYVGHKSLTVTRLNFVLTRDQAKALSEELLPGWCESYVVEFTVQKEKAKGGYPIAKIISVKKTSE